VHAGHAEVHQDQVRTELSCSLDGLLAPRGFANDLETTVRAQDLADPIAKQGVVVDEQDSDGHAPLHLMRSQKRKQKSC
jgi:hypothetical protein